MDPIGDFLTIIRNGLQKRKRFVSAPCSKEKLGIATVLKEEGYIRDYQRIEDGCKASLKVFLKYVDGKSVVSEITRISTPGRRRYEGLDNMTSVVGGLGVSILTTNLGIITDKQARKSGIGGEVLCHVW